MAAIWTLHIQTGDPDDPTRVLELGSSPVRVGRGIQCEVRLNQVGLGDVQCTLRRRNNEWQVQPVGPPGRIWIDNRPTETQRPLAIGAELKVGRASLTIHETDPNGPERGSFAAPISLDAEPVDTTFITPEPQPEPVLAPPPVAPEVEPGTSDPGNPDSGQERLQRWQSRLDQRDQWLRDRQSEKRWEARWKAAGETLRTRSTPPAPPSPSPPPPRPESTSPSAPSRPPLGRTPGARSFEPRPVFGHLKRPAEPERPAEPPRSLLPPGPAESAPPPTALIAPPPEPLPAPPEPAIVPPAVAAVPIEPAPPLNDLAAVPEPIEPPSEEQAGDQTEPAEVVVAPVEVVPAPPVERVPAIGIAPESVGTMPPESPRLVRPSRIKVARVKSPRRINLPAEPPAIVPFPGPEATRAAVEARARAKAPAADEAPSAERVEPAVPADPPPSAAAPAARRMPAPPLTPLAPALATGPPEPARDPAERPPFAASHDAFGPARPRPGAATPGSKEWPSARTIFAAQGSRATNAGPSAASSATEPARKRPMPAPTAAVRPDEWTIPLFLGWLPSVAVVAALGCFAVGLAVVWLEDASSGNIAVRLATRVEGAYSPVIDPQTIPKSAWWQTTASHLAAWALALERVGNGDDRTAEARALEADARSVSPLGARARFVSEPIPGQEADASASIRLGPTRDVVTLTAMGHRLRREGKRADAIRAYAAAFRTAATTPRATLSRPTFRADPQISRYALPHSSLLDPVARDMVAAGDWTDDEWTAATPDFGPALLAVAAALRSKDAAEADRRLEAICQGAARPLDERFEAPEHQAALAEALAERKRWSDAVARYRLAIDGETRDLDRRVWWFNLAEVARRTGDESLRTQAIEAAKGADLSDEVTQRAANAYKNAPDAGLSARNR